MALREQIVFLEDNISHFGFGRTWVSGLREKSHFSDFSPSFGDLSLYK